MTGFQYLVQTLCASSTDDCMIWPHKKDRDGYGRVSMPNSLGGKRVAAHRLAYKIVHGEWPEPMGLHTCDNPSCFNSRHIYAGTDQDNKNDQMARGRTIQGTAQPDAKLTDELVAQARREYANGDIGFAALGKRYGVTKIAIQCAVTGKTWKHVPGVVLAFKRGRICRSTCSKGHTLTPDNIYFYPPNTRQCKQCTKLRGMQQKVGVR